jgi:hypothetical protein
MWHGKRATLTSRNNTSISAVAVLRQPSGSDLVIDLHHNPHARVPIPPTLSAPFVRKQYAKGLDDPDRREPSVLDLMQSAEWQEWLDDPEGKCDREVEKCLVHLVGNPNPFGHLMPPAACLSSSSGTASPSWH